MGERGRASHVLPKALATGETFRAIYRRLGLNMRSHHASFLVRKATASRPGLP
jgi:hypothetical protein